MELLEVNIMKELISKLNSLYFELKITNLDGEESTCPLQLIVTEVTKTHGE